MRMLKQSARARAGSKPLLTGSGKTLSAQARETQGLDSVRTFSRRQCASAVINPLAMSLAGSKGAGQAHIARVRQLQRTHGNLAVERWIREASSTSGRPIHIERDAAPNDSPLIDRYQQALKEENWTQAAILLNGFNDADILARVNDTAELPLPARLQLRMHTPDWASRVRRPLLMLDYNDAKTAGQWANAAKWLNGFNDDDIQLLASQLRPAEIAPMVHGAQEALQGGSLNRVVQGIANRYDKTSADPLGTKTLSVVGLMQAAGTPVSVASSYLQFKLGVAPAPAAAARGSKSSSDRTADINVLSTAMKSGGALAAAGIAGKRRGPQPAQLERGNLAHELIGDTYCALNPPSVFDLSVFDILGYAKGRVPNFAKGIKDAQADMLRNFDMRPDIADLGKMQIFEIKPIGSTALAVIEAKLYIELFNGLGLPSLHFALGQPGNRGTRGMVPGPEETLVWASPLPGAIVYAFVRPPESPRRMQERIEGGATEPGLHLGPEAILSFGFAGAGALAALPEISAIVVGTYEALIPILIAAAKAADQSIPQWLPATR